MLLFFLLVNRGPNTYLGKVKKSRGGDLVLKGSTEWSKWIWVLKTPPVSNRVNYVDRDEEDLKFVLWKTS